MDEDALQASFDCFGLSPEANMDEVEKAFRELRNLYSEESLASYSLFEGAERQEKLESLQAAFDLIMQSRLQTPAVKADPDSDEVPRDPESQVVFIDADPQLNPGLFLQQTRQARGVSLREVAERTKVSSFHLQSIEEQRFDALPAPVYLRGFLKEFTRMLKVPDAEALIESFMALYLDNSNR